MSIKIDYEINESRTKKNYILNYIKDCQNFRIGGIQDGNQKG